MNNAIIELVSQPDKYYGISIDTIFTTFITIFIFILGYLIRGAIKEWNENSRLMELREYYFVLVIDLFKPIERHITLINNLSDDIAERNLKSVYFQGEKGFYFGHILRIDQKDLYKAFVQKNRKLKADRFKQFKLILDNLEYLRTIPGSLKENFLKYYDSFTKYLDIWNENIDFIGRKYDFYMHEIKKNDISPSSDPFFREIDLINYKSSQLEDYRNMFIAIENYIKPLKELTKKYSQDPRSIELLPAIMKCQSSFENMQNLKIFYSKHFNNVTMNLKDIKDSIEAAVKFFKN